MRSAPAAVAATARGQVMSERYCPKASRSSVFPAPACCRVVQNVVYQDALI